MSGADAEQARLADAISGALPDQIVTRWITLIEVIDPDGKRAVYTIADEAATAWDAMGLLTYATELERAAVHHDHD